MAEKKATKSTPKKEATKEQPKKVYLYSVVDFVRTAQASGLYPSLDRVKAAGFVALMQSKDMFFVEDEKVFKEELDKFMNL